MKYITPSLYEGYRFYLSLDKDRKEFLSTLNKEKFERTQQMIEGISFENDVMIACDRDIIDCDDERYIQCCHEVADIVRGGIFQQRVSYVHNYNGDDVLVTGKPDCINRDFIYDIKYSQNFYNGKYYDSIQHLVYMRATGIKRFKYISSDGRSVAIDHYEFDNASETLLSSRIDEMLGFIYSDAEFAKAYEQNWVKP